MLTAALASLLLAPTLKEVRDLPFEFNSYPNEVRLIVVVSPTSMRGASTVRKVQNDVLDPLVGLPIRTFVVWTPMLRDDDRDKAQEATRYASSAFVSHYWDPIRTLPKELGPYVKLPGGRELAWDSVFVFAPGQRWEQKIPAPKAWMHQFGKDENSFDPVKLREVIQTQLKPAPPGVW